AYRYAFQLNNESMEMLITFAGIIGVVLALASCIAIINSFNSNIKERRQQIGMLRAVGTTRRQIIKLLGREALIISLISIPISLVISYLFVLALSNVFGEGFVLTIDVKSIVVCGAVGLITVMLAALIPIINATRITPMQAIRNVDVARKMKIKKIKTQKNYSVPKLLAKRSMAFHKGTQIAVSILLVSTILFSCFGFSFVSLRMRNPSIAGYDYRAWVASSDSGQAFTNSFDKSGGMSDADKQSISAAPYISKAFGVKSCNINVLIDEYTDYFKILAGSDVYENFGLDDYNGSNYAELFFSNFNEYYSDIKVQTGFTKDFLPTTLYAVDDWKLEELESHLVSGKINLDKLASGEEIILVAPQKAAVCVQPFGNGGYYEINLIDDKIDHKYDYDIYGEYEYKAGDTIDLSMIMGDPDDNVYTETENIHNFEKVDKKVKIGAVISPIYFESNETDQWIIEGADFGVLTSIAGMNKFSKEQYEKILMFVDGEVNDEINEAVTSYVNPILYKYKESIESNYESNKNNETENNSILVALVSLIIIGFTICASLTNNAFTASIRERKRELGTLRAVGISRKEFVESYVRQLLKTFGLGYGLGFGIFTAGYIICHVAVYIKNLQPDNMAYPSEVGIDFKPWVTIAFCIVLFAICSIH
ncbi:MAG: FtsX-like permease family protein, partial [Eubacterium sp.]|nr:FtsX-like permease family protein [Eubacterium sp.]